MPSRKIRTRARVQLLTVPVVASLLMLSTALRAETDDLISVSVDQAKLVRFPDKIATIVVGNPLIADVTLQPGGLVVVTGKGYGATNVIAMDRAGTVLMDRTVQVEGPSDKVVTIYRGVNRESYSCAPVCQRRVTLGDGEGYFKSTMDQAGALNLSATAAGGKVN
jgi:Flp pilus assembly secretin CpaC